MMWGGPLNLLLNMGGSAISLFNGSVLISIIANIIIIYFLSTYIFNFFDINGVSLKKLSFELIYGIFTFNFCLVSPFISEHFLNILDKDQPHRR